MRFLSRFANECILCLEEGILDNPVNRDLSDIFKYISNNYNLSSKETSVLSSV